MPPMSLPDFTFESRVLARGPCSIAGVDEAGRGPLAGPVVAAAVILRSDYIPSGLSDSKQLSAKRRQELNLILRETAIFGLGLATVEEIDAFNILNASLLAMKRAIAALPVAVDHLLVDGNRLPADLPCTAEAIVGGDACCLSIAAASIVAKVERDRIMVDLAQQHPGYGWETNAGYPTADHRAALEKLGVTAAHRRSFRPVYNILYQDISVSA